MDDSDLKSVVYETICNFYNDTGECPSPIELLGRICSRGTNPDVTLQRVKDVRSTFVNQVDLFCFEMECLAGMCVSVVRTQCQVLNN